MIASAIVTYAFIISTTALVILAIAVAAAAALQIAQAAGAFDVPPPDIEDAKANARAARQSNMRRQQMAFGFQDTVSAPLGGATVQTGTAVQIAPPVPRAGPGPVG